MPFPLCVVKRKGKKNSMELLRLSKLVPLELQYVHGKGLASASIHYVMKNGQQATNGHHNYILWIFNMKIYLGY